MPYLFNFPNDTSGMDALAVDTISSVNLLPPFLLLFVWFFVFIAGSGRQKSKNFTADYPMWSVVASLCTLMCALIMSVVAGFIRLEWLVIVIVITIFSGVWLFLERRSSEV